MMSRFATLAGVIALALLACSPVSATEYVADCCGWAVSGEDTTLCDAGDDGLLYYIATATLEPIRGILQLVPFYPLSTPSTWDSFSHQTAYIHA